MKTEVSAVVLTPDEKAFVLRAVGELVEREAPSAAAADVAEMLDSALPPNALEGIEQWIA